MLDFNGTKDDRGGDNWSYKSCKAPVNSSPPTNQHPVFYRLDALPVTQPTVSEHWRAVQHTHKQNLNTACIVVKFNINIYTQFELKFKIQCITDNIDTWKLMLITHGQYRDTNEPTSEITRIKVFTVFCR